MFGTILPGVQPARYGAVALLFATSLHAADWISLRGAGVELVSDASEKTARAALQRLSEIRAILPAAEPDSAPLRIFLFAKDSEYRAYAPNATAEGFYQSGFDRDYIAMRAGAELPRVVAHEYVHFATNQRGLNRPAWLDEGLAEYYSNYDGRQLGRPIPEHLRLLQGPWLTPEELNQPTGSLNPLFYAQSWALVHMLRRETVFPQRVTAKTLDELRLYVRSLRGVPVKAQAARVAALAEPVGALNALLLRADLALHAQKTELARRLYDQAARDFPNSSAAATGLGAVAYAAGDREGARTHLRRALQLNDRDALAWFELGMLENDQGALEIAARLNPDLGEAHILLGVRATDDGRLTVALQHLGEATRLLPRKAYAWYSLGYAQYKQGDAAAARESLARALATATTPEQRRMALTLLDSLARN